MIQTDVDLSADNTMALPCVATAVASISHCDELEQALSYADVHKLQTLVLGGGSNLLLPAELKALVLRPQCRDVHIQQSSNASIVDAYAGKNWHELVQQLLKQGIHGFENLALIPGLVGASVIQNIGAYGVEVGDFVESVKLYDMQLRRKISFSKEQCHFAYRDSVFKQAGNRYWVDSIRFRIPHNQPLKCDYPALKTYFVNASQKPSPQALFDAVVAVRSSKLPKPADIPNCGSFFKNPVVNAEQAQALLACFPDMPQYLQNDGLVKLAAAWLIEQCAWKGKQLGRVAMHSAQALVMVNKGNASLEDVLALQLAVSRAVLEKFSVALEREPVLVKHL